MIQKTVQGQESRDPFKSYGFDSIKEAVQTSVDEVKTGMLGLRKVLPTKWPRLNRNLLGGLQPGKMYVIAGRPGVGKSAFSNQLIFDMLDNNPNKKVIVLYWSFEMPGHQQILRAGSKDVKTQVLDLLSVEEKLSQEAYEEYKSKVQAYNDYSIFFNSIPRTMPYIKEANASISAARPDDLIVNVFDHSRLIIGSDAKELDRLNLVSKGCMLMQAELGVVNILLSQLNRNIEQEHRAKNQYQPLLTDLFGGDSIGQDAHVVIMLQRPYDLYGITEEYCEENPVGLLAAHIEKNRDGLLGMIPYEADLSTFTISERVKKK